MLSFQLRSLPGTAWPAVPPPETSQLWAAYLELNRTQWLSPAELEERQLQQLRVLLLHCFHEVAYYRRILTEIGYPKRPIKSLDDFRRLPLLTRERYQANSRDLQAKSLPQGMKPAGEGFTSGTNGVPIKVLKTNHVALWWNALYLRDLEWSNIDPSGRLAMIRLVAMTPEALPRALEGQATEWNHSLLPLLETGPAFVMDVRQDPRAQLDWLRRVRPTCLLSLPSNLELLAGLLRDKGERLPSLQVVQTFGEPLSEASRQRIEEGFGVPTKKTYGTTEAGHIASPCPMGHGLHVHSENLIAEVPRCREPAVPAGRNGTAGVHDAAQLPGPLRSVRHILDDVDAGGTAVSLRPRSSATNRSRRPPAPDVLPVRWPAAIVDGYYPSNPAGGRGRPIPDHPTGGCARGHSRRAGPDVDGRSHPADAGGGAARARLRHPGGHRTKGVARRSPGGKLKIVVLEKETA